MQPMVSAVNECWYFSKWLREWLAVLDQDRDGEQKSLHNVYFTSRLIVRAKLLFLNYQRPDFAKL